ncbi:putative cell division protein ZipA [Actinobacillus pleuropneumoniae]|uniref:Cell division protein ZipA n=1 Tax=Actinobacillus pleuropneumoniae TaxID=715 RepID=A0ABN5MJI3_ACTPL|nr:cell division protein ZipA [Actinobacillus pleuropneumoniae]ASU15134.1 Cell division protein ZipA [Actinobacillus pleuropneumoniae]AWG95733.1 cell division protein ZipA [Actinobacillus pleuropneumoniae serovar 1 str. 4074]AXA21803.1 cell division protein ZipA [Actinobacillus pleuropneumoniae]EFM93810.1 Cell division protein zipA [Actinobacillus pleuropneumoniae serovar 9 str. CVJ13261]EFM96132.1 Cell division protein zipA [Actinobacillus pleuropneumoniae serovar 10 str. D13039]
MELHILFFILAGLLIAVLIGFSLWSARREKSRIFSNTFSTRPPSTPINNIVSDVPPSLNPQSYAQTTGQHGETEADNPVQIQQEVESSLREIKINLPGQDSAAYQSKVEETPIYSGQPVLPVQPQYQTQVQYQTQPQHIEPAFTQAPQSPIAEATSVLEQSVEELERQAAQGDVDIYSDASVRVELAKNSMQADSVAEQKPVAENNMLTLYVVAPEGQQFRGDYVVQSLEALGFQYGEYQIFHRHQHMGNSASPVIFSVANMMQPGIFDLTKIEHFSTVGLVLFMHLPSEGNDVVNLKLLLKTTENLAQALGGFVLNEHREIFDENSRQSYLARVS